MAPNDYEQNLVIRARNLASEPLEKVAGSITQLSATLGKYTDEMLKGQGGTVGFTAAVQDTGKAFDTLFARRAAINDFTSDVAKMNAALERRDSAVAARDDFKASIPATKKDGQTSEQKDQLAALNAEVKKSETALNAATRTWERAGDTLKKFGIDAKELPSAIGQIESSILELSNALGRGQQAQANYATASKASKEADKEQEAQLDRLVNAQRAEADELNRLHDLSAGYATREGNLSQVRIQAQEREEAAARQHFLLLEQYRAQDAASQRKADDQAKKSATEAAELARFQTLAMSELARTKASIAQGAAAQDAGQGGFSSLAGQLRAVIEPAATARATLEGLEKEVTSLGKEADNTKLKLADAEKLVGLFRLTQAAAGAQAGMIDAFEKQTRAFDAANAKAIQYGEELQALQAKTARATVVSREDEAAINAVSRAYDNAARAALNERQKVVDLSGALKAAGIDSNNLAAASTRLKETADVLAVGLTKASVVANQNKAGGQAGFLGLRPYELTNLSYQVNDVFTQLASGTGVMQVLAQQGGQFFQIFEKNIFQMAGLIPIVLGIGVAVGAGLLLFRRSLAEASDTREFNQRLALSGETATYTGKQLVGLAGDIRKLGISYDDAKMSVVEFMEVGLNPARFAPMAAAARTLADVLGKTVPEAAKMLATGVTGGMDAVMKLNEQVKFLTPSLYEQIKAHYDAGEAGKAQALAMDGVSKATDEAEKHTSGTTKALRELKAMWNDFVQTISNLGALEAVVADLKRFKGEVVGVLDVISRVTNSANPRFAGQFLALSDQRIEQQKKEIDELKKRRSEGNMTGNEGRMLDNSITAAEKSLAAMEARSTGLRNLANETKGVAGAAGEVTSQTNAASLALTVLTEKWKDQREGKFDPNLTGQAAKDADARLLQKREQDLNNETSNARARLPTDDSDASKKMRAAYKVEFDAAMDRVRRDVYEQRARAVAEQGKDPLGDYSIDQRDRGLKGSAATQRDRDKVDKNVDNLAREDYLKQLRNPNVAAQTFEEYKAEKANADRILQARTDGYAAAALIRSQQDAKAGAKALNAEEGLEAKLLALKARVAGKDKTDLDAQLKAIEFRYQEFDIAIAKARRAGGSVAGIGEELAKLKDEESTKEKLAVYEAAIAAKTKERKELNQANNDLVTSGARTIEAGYAESVKINNRLNGEMTELADKALNFAKAMNAANPTPAVQRAIAEFQAAKDDPGKGGKQDVYGTFQSSLKNLDNKAKGRDEVESAELSLQRKGLQSILDTESKIKGAYDRTRGSILAGTAAIRAQAKAALDNKEITQDQYELIIAKTKELAAETEYASQMQKALVSGVKDIIATNVASFFDKVGESVGQLITGQISLKQAISNVGLAFLQMVADSLKQIAQLIIKQLILLAISQLVAYFTGGASTAGGALATGGSQVIGAASNTAASVVTGAATQRHSGGIVGDGNAPVRKIPAWAFTHAPRFHEGGIVGLQPDEVPAVLKKNEEVLTRNDPRNALNGGGKEVTSSAPQPLRQVLVMDPKDLSAAMAGKHGEKVVLTHLKANAGAVKSILNS